MNCEIIIIGDEILIGQVIDTNSSFIAEQLNSIGIEVSQITTVSDSRQHIVQALNSASNRANLIIMTGGLGPTKDDITKDALCQFFNSKLIIRNEVLENIARLFGSNISEINERNRSQAELPDNCTILNNSIGTAPGMWFETNNITYVSLPGVPFEMQHLIITEVVPRLKQYRNGNRQFIKRKTILTTGIPESMLAIKLAKWEENLPAEMKVAYLPSPGINKIRISITGTNEQELDKAIEQQISELNKYIPEAIFGFNEDEIQQVLGRKFTLKQKTIATAESCTGGYIAHLITSVSGCSEYYKGSIVAYSNEIKHQILGVSNDSLNFHGAVSKEVVEQMALGARRIFKTDFAIATSGIAGPGGERPDKPVGSVWIAIATPEIVFSEKFSFGNNRERNIRRASIVALNMLLNQLKTLK